MGATAVLGLGNVLMGDDALGPWAIEQLRARWRFPEEVEVEDLGTPGLDLFPHLVGRRAIVLVDTVRASGPPGEVRLYGLDEVLAHAPGPRISPHDPGLKEALASLRFAGSPPASLLLVGVIPERVDHRVGLSAAVRASLPAVERAVLDELARLGQPPVRRASAGPAVVPWWEQSPVSTEGRLH